MIRRQIICDVCQKMRTELTPGDGFPNWGSLQGVRFDHVDNPSLCPDHLGVMADYLDSLKEEYEDKH